jgi:energy-coupling factor transporter transmembrane protein EcfT
VKSNYRILLLLFLVVFLYFIDPEFALAGPGGAIAKGFFKTWWGKLIMAVLTIVLLPLIIYINLKEFFVTRKNKKILNKLGAINRDFSWLTLNKAVKNAFERVYIAWNNEDMQEVSELVSSWYWQNQQIVHLNEWEKRNLKNQCRLKSIGSIKPLHLEITDDATLEGSRIAFSITANMEDYLIHRETKKVVEGKRGFADEEKIWIMEYSDGKWKLDDIQEGSMSLAFARAENLIPEQIAAAV